MNAACVPLPAPGAPSNMILMALPIWYSFQNYISTIMKLEADINQGEYKIDAYAAGSITVAGTVYATDIIITPEAVIEGRLPDQVRALEETHLATMIEYNPEVVIFGTGSALAHPPDEICQILYVRQTGFEIMDTGAACRAFNFLSGEGRRIVAALFRIRD